MSEYILYSLSCRFVFFFQPLFFFFSPRRYACQEEEGDTKRLLTLRIQISMRHDFGDGRRAPVFDF